MAQCLNLEISHLTKTLGPSFQEK
jgi:hypothetical protein